MTDFPRFSSEVSAAAEAVASAHFTAEEAHSEASEEEASEEEEPAAVGKHLYTFFHNKTIKTAKHLSGKKCIINKLHHSGITWKKRNVLQKQALHCPMKNTVLKSFQTDLIWYTATRPYNRKY